MIRKAINTDVKALAEVHVQCWQEAFDGILPAAFLKNLKPADREELWTKVLGGLSSTSVYVVEENEKMVGFGACSEQNDERFKDYKGIIFAIYVLKRSQRKGYGLSLMKEMGLDLQKRGVEKVGLWVLKDNILGRSFYDSLGGKIVGEKEDTIGGVTKIELAYGWNVKKLLSAVEKKISNRSL